MQHAMAPRSNPVPHSVGVAGVIRTPAAAVSSMGVARWPPARLHNRRDEGRSWLPYANLDMISFGISQSWVPPSRLSAARKAPVDTEKAI